MTKPKSPLADSRFLNHCADAILRQSRFSLGYVRGFLAAWVIMAKVFAYFYRESKDELAFDAYEANEDLREHGPVESVDGR